MDIDSICDQSNSSHKNAMNGELREDVSDSYCSQSWTTVSFAG